MRVLFVTSEVASLVKTGGLADVSAALPRALIGLGSEVRIITPGYPQALARAVDRQRLCSLPDLLGVGPSALVAARLPDSGVPVLLVECPALYDRPGGPYLDEDRREWADNALRFALLNHAAALVATGAVVPGWRADVVHCNDWHAGLVPLLLRRHGDRRIGTLFTIHNLAFQGNFPLATADRIGIDPADRGAAGLEFYGQLSFLKAGIVFSDGVNTVSPNYAREILTPAHGCGLDGVLKARGDIHGILNGVDDEVWNPATDPLLPANYDAHDLAGKRDCRYAWRRALGLATEDDAPLVAFISRITHQKLADVVVPAVERIVGLGAQFAVVGDGDPALEDMLRGAAARHSGRIAAVIGYDETHAHRLYGAADIMLAPARFEPCGLTPIYAMRYGAVPIVRPVGGLVDSVLTDASGASPMGTATGFSFAGETADDLVACIAGAIAAYRHSGTWRGMQRRGMQQDFSWRVPARAYAALYRELLGKIVPFTPPLPADAAATRVRKPVVAEPGDAPVAATAGAA
jgi:starch synthase